MRYKTLDKLYYGGKELYRQAYNDRFKSEDAVHLDFVIGDNQAFFLQNQEVLSLSYEIVKLDKSILKLSGLLPALAKEQYAKKCMIDEIVLTNEIEGVHSSRKEISQVMDILKKQSDRKTGKRFAGLVNKYLKLMSGEKIPLESCYDVRCLYDDVFLEEIKSDDPDNVPDGKLFRKEITEIHSEAGKVIHKGLYPESKIINAMEKALLFLNDESTEPLYRICIFHYLFEYIHPFYDGNGRMGRLILSYKLTDVLEPLIAYRISETIVENKSLYYRAFETCNNPKSLGDLTPFLLMMLDMIKKALSELEIALETKYKLLEKYRAVVSEFSECKNESTLKLYDLLIQASLFGEKGISTEELMREFDATYYVVKKLLSSVRPNLLISEKKGKTMYYGVDLSHFPLDEHLLK